MVAVPRNGYTENLANGQYKHDYMTFLKQLDCDSGDKSMN